MAAAHTPSTESGAANRCAPQGDGCLFTTDAPADWHPTARNLAARAM
jgi:hypothetical protein